YHLCFSFVIFSVQTVGLSVLKAFKMPIYEGDNGRVVYSFVKRANFNPADVFSINAETGEITVKGNLDYEAQAAYEIHIQATDKGSLPRRANGKLLIEVVDVNDNAPEIVVTSLMNPVREDADIGSVVALVTVTDKDGGKNGQIRCKLVGSAPFKLNSNYKNYYSLVVDGSLDRETCPFYNVTITASDEGSPSLSSTSVANVEISDVNDNAPRFLEPAINVYVKENSPVGAQIYAVTAADPDINQNARVTYSLVGDSKSIPITSFVNINSDTGDIISLQSFNYEELKTFQFKVQATDSGVPPLSSNVTVNVLILDENDNNPTILAPYSEHGSVNSESIPYSAEAGYFVHSESAELVLQKSLDREKKSVIHLILTALDGGKPARSGTLKIVIHVMDINDNAPVFSKPLYKAQVTENTPFQTSIVTVSATDLDEGLNSEIVYSFIERGNFNPESLFSINPNTGEITVKGKIDYEENAAYDIRIQARDKGTPSRSVHGKLLVEVVDVNDNVPEIIITSLMSPVKEDAEIGTVVALVTVTDKDGGNNGLTNANILGPVPFKLKLNYKNYYSLTVDGPLDRESASKYNVTTIVTDEGTPPLSSTSVILVHISDVNDNAPLFSEPVVNVYIKENSAVGDTIFIITAADPDIEENAKVTYSLLNGLSTSIPITSVVNINLETGDIISLQSFNYEELKTFKFKVQATDSGVPPLSSNVTVNDSLLVSNVTAGVIFFRFNLFSSILQNATRGYFPTLDVLFVSCISYMECRSSTDRVFHHRGIEPGYHCRKFGEGFTFRCARTGKPRFSDLRSEYEVL
uniref:Cadherin domain-containing protein n=1 Tax=Acanthochromis polyacanthus TaxID=80966 RepID=A0A3Q1EMK9_9TELE